MANPEKDLLVELEDDIAILDKELDISDEDLDPEVGLDLEPEFLQVANDEIGRYLEEINQFPRLTPEQEIDLAKQIEAGVNAKKMLTEDNAADLLPIIKAGEKAREKFINSNYKLVVSIAKRFHHPSLSTLTFLDLVQIGNLGLMYAVDRFDYTRGLKFSTFATWWIKQRIRRDIQDLTHMIRIPVHVQEWLNRIHRLEKANMAISPEELAETLNLTVEKVTKLLQIRSEMGTISLDQIVPKEDSESSLFELLPSDVKSPAELQRRQEFEQYLLDVLTTTLTDRELYIVMQRFGFIDGEAKTLEAIASDFNITRERVRQVEEKALKKLRAPRIQKELRAWFHTR